jgi:Peptidase family M23
MNLYTCFLFCFFIVDFQGPVLLPVNSNNRKDVSKIRLTEIGKYGLLRKARKNVPAHLHTGIDIKRPHANYDNEPVFPMAEGRVISIRRDGAYAQVIIAHSFKNEKYWTLYEHVSGIKVHVNDVVGPMRPIAVFMNKKELDTYGWQFDHFHFEILKMKPLTLKPDKNHPERFYLSYSLVCFETKDLEKYYYDPMEFLKMKLK